MIIYLTTHSGDPISWAIRKFTNSKVSHTALKDPERDIVLHATASGLHFTYLKKFLKSDKIVYKFKIKDTRIIKPYLKMMKLLERSYDFGAILGFIPFLFAKKYGFKLPNYFGSKSYLFCSETFYVFLKYCVKEGIMDKKILKGYKRELFSPEDAYQLMKKFPEYFEDLS